MEISSRTPEGLPSQCPLCGANTNIEFSHPAGDAPCPNCGHLLWSSSQILTSLKRRFQEMLNTSADAITADTPFDDLAVDSLDTVELVMELEEEFDIDIPEEQAHRLQSIGDFVRYIQNRRRSSSEEE